MANGTGDGGSVLNTAYNKVAYSTFSGAFVTGVISVLNTRLGWNITGEEAGLALLIINGLLVWLIPNKQKVTLEQAVDKIHKDQETMTGTGPGTEDRP